MGRRATKAARNVWYEARINAAKYDGRLNSREGAAELLGMSVSSVADAELGLTKVMPVDKAVLMADLYNAPQLLNHFCLKECPIGCRQSISDEVNSIEHVTLNLLKQLRPDDLSELKGSLVNIAADGRVLDSEREELSRAVMYLDGLAKTISELKTICSMINGKDLKDG
jgi:hypothetical protein